MKKLLIAALILMPFSANADYMDVIQVKLKEDCSLEKYRAITKDFNEQWAKDYDYRSELAVPVQNDDLVSIFWLGRSASAEAFGKAWDAWRDGLADPKSLSAKLNERFQKCSTNESRSGYDLF